jgi:hypothetical protein
VLLGLILTEVHSLVSWQDFDQLSVIPPTLRRHFSATTFPKLGRCQQYPTIAHQYGSYPQRTSTGQTVNRIFDLIDDSCLNGWTMGNVASTGANMASFFHDLFSTASLPAGQRLVGEESLAAMLDFKPLVNSWCPGCSYGAGIILPVAPNMTPGELFPTQDPTRANETLIQGHPGEDWGSSSSPLCGYNGAHGFGICLTYNSAHGMNCSKTFGDNLNAPTFASCRVLDAVMSVTGGPRLDCAMPHDPYPYVIPCSWSFDPPSEARALGRAADGGLISHKTARAHAIKRAFRKAAVV